MFTRRFLLILAVALLFALGLLMVFNTSSAEVLDRKLSQSSYEGVVRHLVYGLLAVLLALGLWKLGVTQLLRVSFPLLLFTTALLALVLVPGIGQEINGARRWLGVGGVSFQPSELAKLIIPCYLCDALVGQRLNLWAFAKRVSWVLLPIGLILVEPDNATAGIILMQLPMLFFLTRVRAIYWVTPMLLLGLGATAVALKTGYVARRLQVYLHPEADLRGTGHQPHQAKIAAGSGGLIGRGLGHSLQKLSYLPEAQNDYIAAIYAEETGFVGMTGLIALYMGIGALGYAIALQAQEPRARTLGAALTFSLLIQAAINLGVVSGAVPSTGINLPFFSQGGTSLIANVLAVALILRVERGEELCRA